MSETLSEVYNIALSYVESGLSVIPIRTDGSKAPAISEWKPYQSKRPTEQELKEWFGKGNAGIGIIGGAISGNLERIDFDDSEIIRPWATLCKACGIVELAKKLPLVKTPRDGGGYHLYYRCAQPIDGSNQLAKRQVNENGKETVKILIETRGKGSYTIAPGSPAKCHETGTEYKFKYNDLHDIPVITYEERCLLLDICRSLNEYTTEGQSPTEIAGQNGNRPGDEYNSQDEWRILLTNDGWQRVFFHHETEYWRRPGKPTGISATWNYRNCKKFYVFSNNANPLEANKAYSPFALYATIKHGGNYNKAAIALDENRRNNPEKTDHSNDNLITNERLQQNRPAKTNSMSDLLLEITEEVICREFLDQEGNPYVDINRQGIREIMRADSDSFQYFLHDLWRRTKGGTITSAQVRTVSETIVARIRVAKKREDVFIRVASQDDCIYIDLANDAHEAVRIDSSGWDIITNPPVAFLRSEKTMPLPKPTKDGNLNLLCRFVNVTDSQWILLVAYIVGCFNPRGPYPILCLQGEQGSAKSTTAKVLKRLTDPGIPELRPAPRDDRSVISAAQKNWFLAYTNLSSIPQWLSDFFCCLSTDGGYSTRTLYKTLDETVFEGKRPLCVNSITDIITRGDLLDRTVLLDLEPIPDNKRLDEHTFWKEFETEVPKILGALYDAISTSLQNIKTVNVKSLPRMADFAKWVVAAEESLPWQEGLFIKTYNDNRSEASQMILQSDESAGLIIEFVKNMDSDSWAGTATELLKELGSLNPGFDLLRKGPRILSAELKRMAPNLRKMGIQCKCGIRSNGKRLITLTRNCDTT